MVSVIRSDTFDGPTIVITCPMCRRSAVPAETWEVVETDRLGGILQIHSRTNVFLRCTACGGKLESTSSLAVLKRASEEQLAGVVRPRITVTGFVLALVAITLFWLPLIGALLGIVAVLWNRRVRRWTRMASFVGLALSLVLHVALAVEIGTEFLHSPAQ